ncbi:MAG: hypothetical protein MZV70_70270 [Desulfobacterales bacterium]|nr:hypothetical protein [Desulfobacterales bacterium]
MERRKHRRFQQWNKAIIKSASGGQGLLPDCPMDAYAWDLSLGGARIQCDAELPGRLPSCAFTSSWSGPASSSASTAPSAGTAGTRSSRSTSSAWSSRTAPNRRSRPSCATSITTPTASRRTSRPSRAPGQGARLTGARGDRKKVRQCKGGKTGASSNGTRP